MKRIHWLAFGLLLVLILSNSIVMGKHVCKEKKEPKRSCQETIGDAVRCFKKMEEKLENYEAEGGDGHFKMESGQDKQVSKINLGNGGQGAKDCGAVYRAGGESSGVYQIQPGGLAKPIEVWCHMESANSSWTVIQRRQDGYVSFFQDWNTYRNGFGNVKREYWLGNENIHRLTKGQGDYMLRVELEDWEGNRIHADYHSFKLDSEGSYYTLRLGAYSGVAGDSLTHHQGKPFSTYDKDSDGRTDLNCAQANGGGWWFSFQCHDSNLNGLYYKTGEYQGYNNDGVTWYHWKNLGKYSLKKAIMKIKQVDK